MYPACAPVGAWRGLPAGDVQNIGNTEQRWTVVRPDDCDHPRMRAGRVLDSIATATEHTTLRLFHNRRGLLRGLNTATHSEMFKNINCSPGRECCSVRNAVRDCSCERPPSCRPHLPPHSAKPQPQLAMPGLHCATSERVDDIHPQFHYIIHDQARTLV